MTVVGSRRRIDAMSAAKLSALALAVLVPLLAAEPKARAQPSQERDRPNVLWIYVEDMNGWLGCYGDKTVATPNIDALAARGTRFDRAYVPAPVCSATRSALITGAMQTSLGLHNHRSARANFRGLTMGKGYDAIRLPKGAKTLPEMFREAGYYTFNQGKTDYNFVHDIDALYDRHNGQMNLARVDLAGLWRDVAASKKPFFGQIQLRGGKNRPPKRVDRSKVKIPPYYPDVPLVREEYAHHYDCIAKTDAEVGRIIASLQKAGMLEKTVVFFFSDHGFRMHRHKQFCYEGGIRVPLIAAGPGAPKRIRNDLVSGIDISRTTLGLAGIDAPAHNEGRDLFARDHRPRGSVVSARDRLDYTIDRIRAVVTKRYKYLRNYLTDRPYMQPQYRDPWAVTKKIRAMAAAGELNATQLAFYGESRPAEELYDLDADPHETKNLVKDPAFAEELELHRALLEAWVEASGDRGQDGESEAGLRAVLRRWGDKCVNPEYEPVRKQLAKERAKLPRVLILGDSISMGYTPVVKDQLEGRAWVLRPRENCQGTEHGIKRIDAWLELGDGRWDVIWFNFGLHDMKRVHPETRRNSRNPAHPRQSELDRYEQQLRVIAKKLVATKARVIFATTTPVPKGVRPHRDSEDPARYNAAAKKVMAELGIAVHDLYGFAVERQARIQRRADVHFTRRGSQALGREVTKRLKRALTAR